VRSQRVAFGDPVDTPTVVCADYLPVQPVERCLQIRNRGAHESIVHTADCHSQRGGR
jgi:hypothetical protein